MFRVDDSEIYKLHLVVAFSHSAGRNAERQIKAGEVGWLYETYFYPGDQS